MYRDSFPKVLVCCPTADVKNYCFEEWIENVVNLKYPNFDVVLFDNSEDGGDNVIRLNEIYKSKYGSFGKFICLKSKVSKDMDTMQKLAISHNDCRMFCINNNYDYLLHLESDIFPPFDVIERLMSHSKDVVGGLYYIDEGIGRRLMLQQYIHLGKGYGRGFNYSPNDEYYFIDGSLKQVFHIGLGCVLLKRSVLDKISFRIEENIFKAPDSYFASDCNSKKIKIYADTSIICRHENKNWDTYILKAKYKIL